MMTDHTRPVPTIIACHPAAGEHTDLLAAGLTGLASTPTRAAGRWP